MARIRPRKPAGLSEADRADALDRARTLYSYALVGHLAPPWTREEIETMNASELRAALAEHPVPPTENAVRESLIEAEGGPPAEVFWERRPSVVRS